LVEENVIQGFFKKHIQENQKQLATLQCIKSIIMAFDSNSEVMRLTLKTISVAKIELQSITGGLDNLPRKPTRASVLDPKNSDLESKKFFANLHILKICRNHLSIIKKEILNQILTNDDSDKKDYLFNDVISYVTLKISEVDETLATNTAFDERMRKNLAGYLPIDNIMIIEEKLTKSFKEYERVIKADAARIYENFFLLHEDQLGFLESNFDSCFNVDDFWMVNKYFLDNNLELEI
jgi:hypothetical protein